MLIICPGVHDPALSDRFVAALWQQRAAVEVPYRVLPTQRYAPFNGFSVWSYLQSACDPQASLVLLGFSAGVVGAIAAAQLWQQQGRSVAALIAVDGWGVPQVGPLPFHRVSHDAFTHWSSALLGAGQDSFYADPPVEHLALWEFPDRASGWWVTEATAAARRTTAIAFIAHMVQRYGGEAGG